MIDFSDENLLTEEEVKDILWRNYHDVTNVGELNDAIGYVLAFWKPIARIGKEKEGRIPVKIESEFTIDEIEELTNFLSVFVEERRKADEYKKRMC